MTITYTWKVTGLKTRAEQDTNDVVVQTYWEKIGTDEDGNTGKFSGATPFKPATIDPNNFVPFSELTEEMVIGWIQNIVVGQYAEHVNGIIQKEIDRKRNPVTEPSLPWGNPDMPAPPVQSSPNDHPV